MPERLRTERSKTQLRRTGAHFDFIGLLDKLFESPKTNAFELPPIYVGARERVRSRRGEDES